MFRKSFLPVLMLSIGVISLAFTGCPDRSYQRPVPDYSNMSDAGSDEEVEDEASASMKDE